MLLADAFVIAAANELIKGFAMAVGGVEVAEIIEGQAEGVGLSPGELFGV